MLFSLINLFADDCKPKILGFVPWYQYLKLDSQCNISSFNLVGQNGQNSDLPLVLLAVVDDLLRVAGLVAVLFVVYGGVTYATSQGDPERTKQAQASIINALIGLAIALIAVAFVSFLGNKFS